MYIYVTFNYWYLICVCININLIAQKLNSLFKNTGIILTSLRFASFDDYDFGLIIPFFAYGVGGFWLPIPATSGYEAPRS